MLKYDVIVSLAAHTGTDEQTLAAGDCAIVKVMESYLYYRAAVYSSLSLGADTFPLTLPDFSPRAELKNIKRNF